MGPEDVEMLIQKLAVAISDRIQPAVPFEHELWTTKEIGDYLKVAPKHVVSKFACMPDFPKRIELPIASGGKSHPRWKAIEVVNWVEGYSSTPTWRMPSLRGPGARGQPKTR